MKNAFWFLAVAFLIGPAEAQQSQGRLPTERVAYISSIPAAVRKQMPNSATSCFYGAFKLSTSGPRFLLHLFNPNPKQDVSRSNPYPAPSHFVLHIFQVGNTVGATQQLRLINRVQVDYSGIIDKPKRFGAHLLWLDLKEKCKPIVKFDCFEPRGFAGIIGDEVLVVFSKGLVRKPVVQSLTFGSWRGSNSFGQSNTFDNTEESGLLEIHSYEFIPTDGNPQPPPVRLRWNGEKFEPVKREVTDTGQEASEPR
jgi:hypothetical protein